MGDEYPWSIFPMLKHARRTVGFFKVRGVNINHAELEDALFRDPEVVDFRAEVSNDGDNDVLHLYVESAQSGEEHVVEAIRKAFQVTPQVTLLPRGTIAQGLRGGGQGTALRRQARVTAAVNRAA